MVTMLGNVGRTLLAARGIQAKLCNLHKLLSVKETSAFLIIINKKSSYLRVKLVQFGRNVKLTLWNW